MIELNELPLPDLVEYLRQHMRPDGGQFLLNQSVVPDTLAPAPAASVRTSAPESETGAGVWSAITWGTVEWTNGGMLAGSSGLTVPLDGIYLVTGEVTYDVNNVANGGNYKSAITVGGLGGQIWGVADDQFGVGRATQRYANFLRLLRGSVISTAIFSSAFVADFSLVNHWNTLQACFISNTPANTIPGNVQ